MEEVEADLEKHLISFVRKWDAYHHLELAVALQEERGSVQEVGQPVLEMVAIRLE